MTEIASAPAAPGQRDARWLAAPLVAFAVFSLTAGLLARYQPRSKGVPPALQIGPNLDTLQPTFAQTQAQVEQGGGSMPSFRKTLTAAQIRDVAAFVASRAGTGP